jgi:hypothetical protein
LPGVYRYATSGYEQLSIPGSRRNYPAETTVTVTPAACGIDARWDVLQQHWELGQECYSGPVVTLASYTVDETYYGQTEDDTVHCGPGAYLRPPVTTPGTTWSFSCDSSDSHWAVTASVVGTETVVVGGQPIPALHVHMDTRVSGAEQGDNPQDSWLAPGDAIPLRMTGTAEATQSGGPFGNVTYDEQYSMTLESTTPDT